MMRPADRAPTLALLQAALALVLLAGCSDGGDGARPQVDAADGPDGLVLDAPADATAPDAAEDVGPDAAPPEVGPELSATLQAVLDEYLAFTGQPGVSAALRWDDGRAWAGASGVRVVGDPDSAMDPATVFRVGSGTKPHVATAVMLLVEEGLVDLDAPLTTYLPDYPQWSAVTVRMLLQMQAGLPDYLTRPDFMASLVAEQGEPLEPEDLLAFVAEAPLAYPPGEGCAYSNTNYVLLGMLLEVVTGQPVEEVLHARIADPLGLDDTYLDSSGDETPDLAHGYMAPAVVAKQFGVPVAFLDFVPEEHWIADHLLDITYLFHPTFSWAAGALVSSPRDMAAFVHGLAGGALVTRDTLDDMLETTSCQLLGDDVRYGLGMMRSVTPWGEAWGHGGLNFGYHSDTLRIPGAGLTLSHMHDYLPQQSAQLRDALLGVALDGEPGPPGPCEPPEGFFEADGEPTLLVRFKGPVNSAATVAPRPGIGRFERDDDGDITTLFGVHAQAVLKVPQPDTLRVEVTSIAPAAEDDVDLQAVTVSVAAGTFDALDEGGGYTLTSTDPGAIFYTVSDLWLDPATGQPRRLCIRAVNDLQRGGELQVCHADDFAPAAGRTLRMFGRLALETDPDTVAQLLGYIGTPRCSCPGPGGAWVACEDD